MPVEIRCPETGLPLSETSLDRAEELAGSLYARTGVRFGRTERVLMRSDGLVAYPLIDEVPILMTPEALTTVISEADLTDPRWAEAYAEMDFYSRSAVDIGLSMDDSVTELRRLLGRPAWSPEWLDAPYDATAQLEAFTHMGPPAGRTVLQIGGKGGHAVRALLAGAAEAWLVTPMLSEALYAREITQRLAISERFQVVVGIAEQIPLGSESFDAIYAGGCLHHMNTRYAAGEIERILRPGGRFAAVEPWQTILHRYGTRIIGKREANAHCSPLTVGRLAPMRSTFDNLDVRHHGPALRYLALALLKVTKVPITPAVGLWLTRLDDMLPIPRRLGGSVAVLAQRARTLPDDESTTQVASPPAQPATATPATQISSTAGR